MKPLREGCGAKAGKKGWPRARRGLGRHLPAPAQCEVGSAALRRVPAALGARGRADGSCFLGARSRAWHGAAAAAPSPRAGCLQPRPRGSARPPSPRLRLRRARPRLALPPQLQLGAGSGGSPDPEPGKRRAAGAARGGSSGGAGAAARRPPLLPPGRWVGERRASAEAPRPRGRDCPRGSPDCVSPRARAGERRRTEPPGSNLGPAGGCVPGRGSQPGSPSPAAGPAASQPARTWARVGARRAAGPAKFASPLDAEPRARWGPAPLGGSQSPRPGRQRRAAGRGGWAPPDAACKVRQKKTSAPGRFGPLCQLRPPKPAPLGGPPRPRLPPHSAPAQPRGPGVGNGCDCVRPEIPARGRGGGGGRATWPQEEVS